MRSFIPTAAVVYVLLTASVPGDEGPEFGPAEMLIEEMLSVVKSAHVNGKYDMEKLSQAVRDFAALIATAAKQEEEGILPDGALKYILKMYAQLAESEVYMRAGSRTFFYDEDHYVSRIEDDRGVCTHFLKPPPVFARPQIDLKGRIVGKPAGSPYRQTACDTNEDIAQLGVQSNAFFIAYTTNRELLARHLIDPEWAGRVMLSSYEPNPTSSFHNLGDFLRETPLAEVTGITVAEGRVSGQETEIAEIKIDLYMVTETYSAEHPDADKRGKRRVRSRFLPSCAAFDRLEFPPEASQPAK